MLFIAAALVLSATSPATAASVTTIPDGTYTYALERGASTLGTSTIAIAHVGGAIKIHEVATVAGTSFTVDQTVDPTTYVPSAVDGLYPGAKPAKIHVLVGATGASESVQGTAGSQTLAYPAGSKGLVVLDGPVMAGFFLAQAQSTALASSELCGITLSGAAIIPLHLAVLDPSTRPTALAAPDRGIHITGLQSGDIMLWYDAALVPQEVDVPSQGVSIVLKRYAAQAQMNATAPPAPEPLPTAYPHFSSRDVTFRSADGTVLAGTLTVPDDLRTRAPAIVLVQGSGAVNRDEQVGPNPIFLELSNALSNHGYVVLRYDKRGVGKSSGNANLNTRDDLLADARAAIAFVARRSSVDARRVFVVGHSEGGELAPSLAAGGAPLRGIALMAPPAIPLDQILVQQASRGLTGSAAAKARADQEHANFAIRSGLSTAPGSIWLRTSFGVDPAQVIRRVPCPILILQGGKDFQVLASDLPRLVDAARAAHRDVTVRVFPDDDHLFITVPGDAPADVGEYMVPHRIDPAMIDAMLAWLDEKSR